MKQIIRALASKLSRPKDPVVDDQSSNTVSVDDVLMPDIYGDEDDGTMPILKIPRQPFLEVDESAGFDPYDTVKMHKK